MLPISRVATTARAYAAGSGPNESTALESVIKVREAAYGWIDALALEQFLHGPIVAVNEGDIAALVNVSGPSEERTGQIAALSLIARNSSVSSSSRLVSASQARRERGNLGIPFLPCCGP